MANEINDLSFNNTNITFQTATNNIATSDETEAAPIYQTKMGTAYSRSKNIARAINFAGVSLILTAAAIKTGSLISNAYVLNPPSVGTVTYAIKDKIFSASFTVSNPAKYQMYYYLYIDNDKTLLLKEDCSEEKEYLVSYDICII